MLAELLPEMHAEMLAEILPSATPTSPEAQHPLPLQVLPAPEASAELRHEVHGDEAETESRSARRWGMRPAMWCPEADPRPVRDEA